MRRTGMIGLCMVAVLATGAAMASSASAAEYPLTGLPELGRCVKVPAKTGKYSGRGCVIHKANGKGNHEWMPGPDGNPKFTAFGEKVALVTVGGKGITCGGSELTGEWLDGKTASATLTLIGCALTGTTTVCQSNPVEHGEINSESVEGELGFIRGGNKPIVGLDLKPKAPGKVVFKFQCGVLPEVTELATVEGSVIGTIKPMNVPSLLYKLFYKQVGGKQAPQQFEGGVKDTLTTTFVSGLTSTTEESGLSSSFPEFENEEPLVIKSRQVER